MIDVRQHRQQARRACAVGCHRGLDGLFHARELAVMEQHEERGVVGLGARGFARRHKRAGPLVQHLVIRGAKGRPVVRLEP